MNYGFCVKQNLNSIENLNVNKKNCNRVVILYSQHIPYSLPLEDRF
jgi:hypothetical protein